MNTANPTFHMHLANTLPNGAQILARHHTGSRWIVLAVWKLDTTAREYVTWCVDDDGACYWGHYFTTRHVVPQEALQRAENDYRERIARGC